MRHAINTVIAMVLLMLTASTGDAQAPANDNFANAQQIDGLSGVVAGNNVGATLEPGESGVGIASVWYKWQPAADVCMNMGVQSGPYQFYMAIYTGTTVDQLTLVAADANSGRGNWPLIVFHAVAGTTYYIRITAMQTPRSFTLTWTYAGSGPPNDNFENAAAIQGISGSTSGTTVGATRQCGEDMLMWESSGEGGSSSVWYRWTAPESGTIMFNTVGSNYDTMLGVYTGDDLMALTTVAKNDDFSGWRLYYPSRVIFTAVAGTEYRIRVDGYDNKQGSVVLNWGTRVTISNRSTREPIMNDASSRFLFVVYGRVSVLNANEFNLDDGSGVPVHVFCTSHGRTDQEYAMAEGMLRSGTELRDVVSTAKLD